MKERPILFNTEMVQALLEGRKTQTRMVVKGAPQKVITKIHEKNDQYLLEVCPYGKVGDVLWVRETWQEIEQHLDAGGTRQGYIFKADPNKIKTGDTTLCGRKFKWKPSIFMLKEACRLRLKIINIIVERLQDISEEDAKSEGIIHYFEPMFNEERFKDYTPNADCDDLSDYPVWREAITSFSSLWNSINGGGEKDWNANPWVWVVKFEVDSN